MEVNSLEGVDDGSGSPDSVDDDMNDPHLSEDHEHDQGLSKNRSKRKPSKTQIKHIAPLCLNYQPLRDVNVSAGSLQNYEDVASSHSGVASSHQLQNIVSDNANGSIGTKEGNCDTSKYGTQNMEDLFNDVTQGIFRESNSSAQGQGQSQGIQRQRPVTRTPKKRRSTSTFHTLSHPRSGSSPSRSSPCYPCGICGKVFRVPSRYESHMLGHSKGKPYCCNTCGKMFASQEKLDRHLPVHNCDRNAAYTCEACGKVR